MDRRLLAAAYDRSAEGYDERFRDLQRPKFRAAAPYLQAPAGSLCLDAGGGTALLLEWAQAEQPRLLQSRWVELDVSLGMLEKARARTPLLVAADLARLPLPDGACALVCAFTSVLADVPRTLRELQRVTAPRGALVVSFLRDEAPPLDAAALDAGQDRIFVLRKE